MGISSEEKTGYDNAPPQDVLSVHGFLPQKSIPKLDQPPYSPDLAPLDFWLFSKLKMGLKRIQIC